VSGDGARTEAGPYRIERSCVAFSLPKVHLGAESTENTPIPTTAQLDKVLSCRGV